MSNNRINATLSAEDKSDIMAAINTIKQKLPFLVDLSPEERRAMLKLGDKSVAFVNKTLEVALQNSEFLPRSFEVADFQRDVQLLQDLQPVVVALTQLQELVTDTLALSGSEAYAAALTVYHYAKSSGHGAGLDTALDDMGKRFARKSQQSPPAPPPPPPSS